MATQFSAGIVLHRISTDAHARTLDHNGVEGAIEILLVHPGGPFWANKDQHGWSIPKGEFDPDTEDGEVAARREFEEELGRPAPSPINGGTVITLPAFKAGRKTITAWLIEADFDAETINSNNVEIEWPPRSGRTQLVPEVDQAAWFTLTEAREKLHKGQASVVDLIIEHLGARFDPTH